MSAHGTIAFVSVVTRRRNVQQCCGGGTSSVIMKGCQCQGRLSVPVVTVRLLVLVLLLQVVMAALDKPRNIQSKGSIGDIVTDTGTYATQQCDL